MGLMMCNNKSCKKLNCQSEATIFEAKKRPAEKTLAYIDKKQEKHNHEADTSI